MALSTGSVFWLICSFLVATVFAQVDTSTCTEGCSEFDIQYSNAYYYDGPANDTDTSTFPALLNAVCTFGGTIPPVLADLQNCVNCNKDGLGMHPIYFYQEWTIECGVYLGTGFQSALSILSSWDRPTYTSFFSASVLGVLSTATTVYPITLDAAATPTTFGSSVTSSASVASSSSAMSTDSEASSAVATLLSSAAITTPSTSAPPVVSVRASSLITSASIPGTSSIPALIPASSTASTTVTPAVFPPSTTGVSSATSTTPAAASTTGGASAVRLEQFSVIAGMLVLFFNCLM